MKQIQYKALVVLFSFMLTSSFGWAQTYTGKVVAIADGDTFTLLTDEKEQKKIRLAEIDTPEKGQPYGQRARQVLSDLVFGKWVKVDQTDMDRYGRIVARVYQGNLDVNAELVREGAAWVYREYAKVALEEQTRAAQKDYGACQKRSKCIHTGYPLGSGGGQGSRQKSL